VTCGVPKPWNEMIRVLCPHCSVTFLVLVLPEDDEEVVCPHCHRPFVPDEEEWVDPEDE
jgi:NMD protein affecting ribosome stability and mRNA decay